jgi:predicted component of type VI protein secretion system
MSLLNKFRPKEAKKNLKEEIFEHICDLLNTKKGYGSPREDFGLDNYVYLDSNNSINKKIIHDIKECLEKHEGRLKVHDVRSVPNPNPFFLSFVIDCNIENAPHSFQISFHHQKKSFDREIEP